MRDIKNLDYLSLQLLSYRYLGPMDTKTLFFASYELLLSLIFALLTVYLAIKLLNLTFLRSRKTDLLIESNTAVAVFAGAMVISVLLLVKSSVMPSVETLRAMVLHQDQVSARMVFISLGFFALFYLAAALISVGILFLTVQMYMLATVHIDELAEVRKNNVPVAVFLSAVVIGVTLFIEPGVQRFIHAMVDWEYLEQVEHPPTIMTPPAAKNDGMVTPVLPPTRNHSLGQ